MNSELSFPFIKFESCFFFFAAIKSKSFRGGSVAKVDVCTFASVVFRRPIFLPGSFEHGVVGLSLEELSVLGGKVSNISGGIKVVFEEVLEVVLEFVIEVVDKKILEEVLDLVLKIVFEVALELVLEVELDLLLEVVDAVVEDFDDFTNSSLIFGAYLKQIESTTGKMLRELC